MMTDETGRILELWCLSRAEAAMALATKEAERDLIAATAELERRLKADRIATVVRRPADVLGGESLLEMALRGEHAGVRKAVAQMFALPR